jgi:malate dehydrogenase (quinone)
MSNAWPMMSVGMDEYPLVEYLAGQLMLSDDDRFAALQEYFPGAKQNEWRLWQAGQRVQIIKRDADKGGVLKLGTEIVSAKDGSIAALLGASPGASTAAPIMLQVLEKVFAEKVASPEWQAKIHQIVPSYGTKLNADPQKTHEEWVYTSALLQLPTPPQIDMASLSNAATATPAAPASDNAPVKPVGDLAP